MKELVLHIKKYITVSLKSLIYHNFKNLKDLINKYLYNDNN